MTASESGTGRLVAVYERVSSEQQDIARQRAVREDARRLFPDVELRVFSDHGVSATRFAINERPQGRLLCEAISAGQVEALFTDQHSRLSRGDDVEWSLFRSLCEQHGVRLFINGSELRHDLGGLIMGTAAQYLARQEVRDWAHRSKGGKREKTAKGIRCSGGGRRPYGYREVPHLTEQGKRELRLEVVPEEAGAIQLAFDLFEGGWSQVAIARRLGELGYRTAEARPFKQRVVGRLLRSQLVRGWNTFGAEAFPGSHEAIIDSEQWGRVQAILADRPKHHRQGGRPPAGSHLLTSSIFICSCGSPMLCRSVERKATRWEAYACSGRNNGSTACVVPVLQAKVVDEAILEHFTAYALDIDAMVQDAEEARALHLRRTRVEAEAADREFATASERLARVRRSFQDGILEPADWVAQRIELTSELEAAEAALSAARQRERDIEATVVGDAESEALRTLARLRDGVSERLADAAGVEALRSALRAVFEVFQLHWWQAGGESEDSGPEIIFGELAHGQWVIEPIARAEFLEQPGLVTRSPEGELEDVLAPRYRRVPILCSTEETTNPFVPTIR